MRGMHGRRSKSNQCTGGKCAFRAGCIHHDMCAMNQRLKAEEAETYVVSSSGSVFADLDLPEPSAEQIDAYIKAHKP